MKHHHYLPEIYRFISYTTHYPHTHGLFDNKCWTPRRLVWMLEKDGYVKVIRRKDNRRFERVEWISREKFDGAFVEKYLAGKNFKDYQEIEMQENEHLTLICVTTQLVMLAGLVYFAKSLGMF